MSSKNLIWTGPADGANTKPLTVEGAALSAILPGTLVKQTATGLDTDDLAGTTFGKQQFLIANKDEMRTKLITEAWPINENMIAVAPRSGEFMNVLTVTAQTLAIGSPLSRNGAGLLKLATTPVTVGATSEEVVAYATEVITTSGTELVNVRIA